jgi:hypothetical protein
MAHGQGDPLPSFMEIDGEWIVKDHLFLDHSAPPNERHFTRTIERKEGSVIVGFRPSHLAAAFEIDVSALRIANQLGRLIFTEVTHAKPTRGGASARAYGFKMGDREIKVVVEVGPHDGKR